MHESAAFTVVMYMTGSAARSAHLSAGMPPACATLTGGPGRPMMREPVRCQVGKLSGWGLRVRHLDSIRPGRVDPAGPARTPSSQLRIAGLQRT